MFGTQQSIDDVTIIGEQDEPFGVSIEPPHRKHTFGMADEVDDVASDTSVSSALDANRFVQRQVNLATRGLRRQAIHGHGIIRQNAGAQRRHGAIHTNATRGNPRVRFPPRAHTGFSEPLVEAGAGGSRVRRFHCILAHGTSAAKKREKNRSSTVKSTSVFTPRHRPWSPLLAHRPRAPTVRESSADRLCGARLPRDLR